MSCSLGRGTWVNRKDDRNAVRDHVDCAHDRGQTLGRIHVGRPMQGKDGILPCRQAVRQREFTRAANLLAEGIDHRVTDEVDLLLDDTFIPQILVGVGVGGKKKIRNGIRAEAVDLLRHGHVP